MSPKFLLSAEPEVISRPCHSLGCHRTVFIWGDRHLPKQLFGVHYWQDLANRTQQFDAENPQFPGMHLVVLAFDTWCQVPNLGPCAYLSSLSLSSHSVSPSMSVPLFPRETTFAAFRQPSSNTDSVAAQSHDPCALASAKPGGGQNWKENELEQRPRSEERKDVGDWGRTLGLI